MHVCVVGLNHSTTPISIRERVAVSTGQLRDALLSLHNYLAKGVVLSTCNRTEVYAVDYGGSYAELAIANFISAYGKTPSKELLPYVYTYRREEAVRHLFHVAAGLDSMIIGEYEVLGQVSQALEAAEKAKMVDLPLRNLFRHAIRSGRRAREETGISKNPLSVSSVAAKLAARNVSSLQDCRVLIIGAGEAGKLAAKAIRARGASQLVVISRSPERASALASDLGGRAAGLDSLKEELSTADVVISCTGAPHFILDRSIMEEVMSSRPEHPLVLVDIAVPRDVEPEARQIGNVILYDIDELTEISHSHRKQREKEIRKAVAIVEEEVEGFASWWQTLRVKPTVSALVRKAENIRQAQLGLTLKKLRGLSDEERGYLEAMTKAIVTKMLHDPIQGLKRNAHKKDYAQMINELFRLDRVEPE